MNPDSPAQGVWFPKWTDALDQARLRDFDRRAYRIAIFEFLRFCKHSRQRATVTSARDFMVQVEEKRRLPFGQQATWKAALMRVNKVSAFRKTRGLRRVSDAEPPVVGLTSVTAEAMKTDISKP